MNTESTEHTERPGRAVRAVAKIGVAVAALCLLPLVASHRAEAGKAEGVGIGAGLGAVVAGPVGAVVGGVVGYKVGGPNLLPRKKYKCWTTSSGRRKCVRRRSRGLRQRGPGHSVPPAAEAA